MNIAELSDLDADALTITTRRDQTWITCTADGNEVTVGPLPTKQVLSALPADGVTTALIEKAPDDPDSWMERWKEAAAQREQYKTFAHLWKEAMRRVVLDLRQNAITIKHLGETVHSVMQQRDKAEQERDEALGREAVAIGGQQIAEARAEQSRGFTAEDVDDAAVGRFRTHMWEVHDVVIDPGDAAEALRAALTPPPARDPQAVALEDDMTEADLEHQGDMAKIADSLASLGWTKEER